MPLFARQMVISPEMIILQLQSSSNVPMAAGTPLELHTLAEAAAAAESAAATTAAVSARRIAFSCSCLSRTWCAVCVLVTAGASPPPGALPCATRNHMLTCAVPGRARRGNAASIWFTFKYRALRGHSVVPCAATRTPRR